MRSTPSPRYSRWHFVDNISRVWVMTESQRRKTCSGIQGCSCRHRVVFHWKNLFKNIKTKRSMFLFFVFSIKIDVNQLNDKYLSSICMWFYNTSFVFDFIRNRIRSPQNTMWQLYLQKKKKSMNRLVAWIILSAGVGSLF